MERTDRSGVWDPLTGLAGVCAGTCPVAYGWAGTSKALVTFVTFSLKPWASLIREIQPRPFRYVQALLGGLRSEVLHVLAVPRAVLNHRTRPRCRPHL